MSNSNQQRREVIVGNTRFAYTLEQLDQNTFDLSVTPCNNPTAVYCIGRISIRENCCNNMRYYQSFINTDPVEIIQDCNLEDIIRRSIAMYFNNLPTFDVNGNNCGCNRNRTCGLF